MTVYCAVPGCSSNSRTTDYTFHRFPRNLITRARWILALPRPIRTLGSCAQVCGRHFEKQLFSDRRVGGLVKNAVPTLYMPPKQSTPLPQDQKVDKDMKETLLLDNNTKTQLQAKLPKVAKIRRKDTRLSSKTVSDELIACRACLAAEGRLYAISGSGLEDALVTFAGIAPPFAEGLPRHLCVFCVTKLSKCVAFRDSCQRSTALLQTLLEKGRLTMNEIKTVDRQTHKLTKELTQTNVYHFQTHPYLDIPVLKNQSDDSLQVPDYTEVEYLESDCAEYLDLDDSEDKIDTLEKKDEIIKVEFKVENSYTNSDIDDVEYKLENAISDVDSDSSEETIARAKVKTLKLGEDTVKSETVFKNMKSKVDRYPTDIDTDTSEETIELRKKVKMKKLLLKNNPKTTVIEELPYKESLIAFAKEFNCEVKQLSKEEQKQEVEERKRNNKSDFCCDLCGKGFKNENTIRTHLSYHDMSLPYECEVCRLRFRSRRKLMKHQDCHRARFTCNECGHVSRNRTYAKDHYLVHKGRTLTCPHCQAEYNRPTSYYNHIRMQHPAVHEACDECGETFAGKRGILMHKNLRHRKIKPINQNLECTDCDVLFRSSEALQRHVEYGAGVPHAALWPCPACGDSCGSQDALVAHAAERHRTDQHHCDECNKTFQNLGSFKLHWHRKHLNRRASSAPFRPRPRSAPAPANGPAPARALPAPCVCELCGKLLKNSTLLQYHMNGHLDVKPFQCHHCPKSFAHRTAIIAHMRVHTGERPYRCDQCPLAFSMPSNLNRHIKQIHLKQYNRVECKACGKIYDAASINSHIRYVHMKQPYVRRKRDRKKRLVNES